MEFAQSARLLWANLIFLWVLLIFWKFSGKNPNPSELRLVPSGNTATLHGRGESRSIRETSFEYLRFKPARTHNQPAAWLEQSIVFGEVQSIVSFGFCINVIVMLMNVSYLCFLEMRSLKTYRTQRKQCNLPRAVDCSRQVLLFPLCSV